MAIVSLCFGIYARSLLCIILVLPLPSTSIHCKKDNIKGFNEEWIKNTIGQKNYDTTTNDIFTSPDIEAGSNTTLTCWDDYEFTRTNHLDSRSQIICKKSPNSPSETMFIDFGTLDTCQLMNNNDKICQDPTAFNVEATKQYSEKKDINIFSRYIPNTRGPFICPDGYKSSCYDTATDKYFVHAWCEDGNWITYNTPYKINKFEYEHKILQRGCAALPDNCYLERVVYTLAVMEKYILYENPLEFIGDTKSHDYLILQLPGLGIVNTQTIVTAIDPKRKSNCVGVIVYESSEELPLFCTLLDDIPDFHSTSPTIMNLPVLSNINISFFSHAIDERTFKHHIEMIKRKNGKWYVRINDNMPDAFKKDWVFKIINDSINNAWTDPHPDCISNGEVEVGCKNFRGLMTYRLAQHDEFILPVCKDQIRMTVVPHALNIYSLNASNDYPFVYQNPYGKLVINWKGAIDRREFIDFGYGDLFRTEEFFWATDTKILEKQPCTKTLYDKITCVSELTFDDLASSNTKAKFEFVNVPRFTKPRVTRLDSVDSINKQLVARYLINPYINFLYPTIFEYAKGYYGAVIKVDRNLSTDCNRYKHHVISKPSTGNYVCYRTTIVDVNKFCYFQCINIGNKNKSSITFADDNCIQNYPKGVTIEHLCNFPNNKEHFADQLNRIYIEDLFLDELYLFSYTDESPSKNANLSICLFYQRIASKIGQSLLQIFVKDHVSNLTTSQKYLLYELEKCLLFDWSDDLFVPSKIFKFKAPNDTIVQEPIMFEISPTLWSEIMGLMFTYGSELDEIRPSFVFVFFCTHLSKPFFVKLNEIYTCNSHACEHYLRGLKANTQYKCRLKIVNKFDQVSLVSIEAPPAYTRPGPITVGIDDLKQDLVDVFILTLSRKQAVTQCLMANECELLVSYKYSNEICQEGYRAGNDWMLYRAPLIQRQHERIPLRIILTASTTMTFCFYVHNLKTQLVSVESWFSSDFRFALQVLPKPHLLGAPPISFKRGNVTVTLMSYASDFVLAKLGGIHYYLLSSRNGENITRLLHYRHESMTMGNVTSDKEKLVTFDIEFEDIYQFWIIYIAYGSTGRKEAYESPKAWQRLTEHYQHPPPTNMTEAKERYKKIVDGTKMPDPVEKPFPLFHFKQPIIAAIIAGALGIIIYIIYAIFSVKSMRAQSQVDDDDAAAADDADVYEENHPIANNPTETAEPVIVN